MFTCAFSPDGETILSGGDALQLWQAASGRLLRTFRVSTHWERAIRPDKHSRLDDDNKPLRVWDIITRRAQPVSNGHTQWVWACVFSPDGRFIVSAGEDHQLWVWEVASGSPLYKLEGHTDGVKACAISPDQRFIASASRDGTMRLWNVSTGRLLHTLKGQMGEGTGCAFTPDGQLCVFVCADRTLKMVNPDDGEILLQLQLPGALRSLGVHTWLPQMVCGDEGGVVYRLEVIGLRYGPIIITPAERKNGLEALCPACQQKFPIDKNQLGNQVTCPTPNCGLNLHINPFAMQPAQEKKSWLSKLIKQ